MGVKVLKQKPSQADAILPCVSLSFHRLQVPTVQCSATVQQTCSILGLFVFSLSLSLGREEEEEEVVVVEEVEGEEGSQMSIYRNVSAGGDRYKVIIIIIII